jgi:hypothetical protein
MKVGIGRDGQPAGTTGRCVPAVRTEHGRTMHTRKPAQFLKSISAPWMPLLHSVTSRTKGLTQRSIGSWKRIARCVPLGRAIGAPHGTHLPSSGTSMFKITLGPHNRAAFCLRELTFSGRFRWQHGMHAAQEAHFRLDHQHFLSCRNRFQHTTSYSTTSVRLRPLFLAL